MKFRTTLLTLVLIGAPAAAADWTVNPGESIQAAIDAAAPGDRILIQPGTYDEVLQIGKIGLLDGKDLELVGVGGAAVTILNGSSFQDSIVHVHSSATPITVSLDGLTLTSGYGYQAPGGNSYGGAIHAANLVTLSVTDCVLAGNGRADLYFAGGAYSYGAGCTIAFVRSLLHGNTSKYSGGATLCDYAGTMTFDACTIADNWSGSFGGTQGGVALANDGDVVVHDSILWGNAGMQIASYGGASSAGNTALVTWSDIQDGYFGAGNRGDDPSFVDAPGGDYTLSMCSPCIDAADPASPLDADGTRADMGYASFGQSAPGFLVDSVDATYSFGPGVVTVSGTGLDTVSQVTLGCTPQTLLTQSATSLTFQPPATAPGFPTLLLEDAGGALRTNLELWPSLAATTTGIAGVVDLTLHNGMEGLLIFASSGYRLFTPLVFDPRFSYGLLLDPSRAIVVHESATVLPAGVYQRSYDVPNDPTLAGHTLFLQCWTQQGLSGMGDTYSFSNLTSVTF